METFTVYILYSSTIDKFYVGYTSMGLPERLSKHNTNHKGFTGQTNDWAIQWSEPFADKTQALRIELLAPTYSLISLLKPIWFDWASTFTGL
jgi:putative endonuclease